MGRLTRGSRREAEPRNISSPENLVETEGGPKPLLMAERFPSEVRAGLAAIGHEVVALGPWEQVMGHAQAIVCARTASLPAVSIHAATTALSSPS